MESVSILYLSLNSLAPCLNVGTNKGFLVYNIGFDKKQNDNYNYISLYKVIKCLNGNTNTI